MFRSQTATNTASWSEMEKKKAIRATTPVTARLRSLHCRSTFFPIKHKTLYFKTKWSQQRLRPIVCVCVFFQGCFVKVKQSREVSFLGLLSFPASSLSWISSSVHTSHPNSSSLHTKPSLSLAASYYLGEEGRGGSGALGGEKRGRRGEEGIRIPALALKLKPHSPRK